MERTFSDAQRVALGKVVARSWSDEVYKSKLLGDPRSALAEAGIDLPEGVAVTVTERKADELHIVLPPNPGEVEGALGDDELRAVAGGFCSCCWNNT